MKIKLHFYDLWSVLAPLPVLGLFVYFDYLQLERTIAGYLLFLGIWFWVLRRLVF